MTCDHETFKCTNGVFSCLKCGAVIPNPYEGRQYLPRQKTRQNRLKRPPNAKGVKRSDYHSQDQRSDRDG